MGNEPKFNIDLDDIVSKPEIEGEIGTVVDLPGDRWIRVLAATENNLKWKARQKAYNEGVRRLSKADVSDDRFRAFSVPYLVEGCCIDWGGFKTEDGVEVPFSTEACKYALLRSKVAYRTVAQVVFDDDNFRGQRLKAIVDEVKN